MSPIRARVHNGRLLVDEPTVLREGMVLDLVVDDEGDSLDSKQREALNAASSQRTADRSNAHAGDACSRPNRSHARGEA